MEKTELECVQEYIQVKDLESIIPLVFKFPHVCLPELLSECQKNGQCQSQDNKPESTAATTQVQDNAASKEDDNSQFTEQESESQTPIEIIFVNCRLK